MSTRRLIVGIAAPLCVVVGVLLFASAPALAVFTRPFIGQITGTPTGPGGELVLFQGLGGLGGLAADASGNLYVGDEFGHGASVFTSSNVFVETIAVPNSANLAFDDTSGKLEGRERQEWIAVDNSTGLTAGDVYSTVYFRAPHPKGSGVVRVTATGEPAPFTCMINGKTPSYISNGDELIGTADETWEGFYDEELKGVAVEPGDGEVAGDLYVLHKDEVDRFTPTGCFLGAISEATAPEAEVFKGFGGPLVSVAMDPTTGDVLVSNQGRQMPDEHGQIDEFTAAGEYLGKVSGVSPREPFELSAPGAIAVNSEGHLYVVTYEPYVVDEFGVGAFYPQVVTGAASDRTPTSATLNGIVNDEDRRLEACKFEYVSEAVFKATGFSVLGPGDEAQCAGAPGSVPSDDVNHEVHAEAKGLSAGTVYRYRLIAATDEGEHGGVKEGTVESFAAPAAPVVEGASVTDVSSSWADFHAVIDPVGSDTTYQFEYVSEEVFATSGFEELGSGGSVPVPAADIGSGDTGVSVNVQADGLSPGTAYRFRVLAVNALGAAAGGPGTEGSFTTLPAVVPGLPDGRSYEMVTPPNKEDAEDLFGGAAGGTSDEAVKNYDRGYSSEDGEHFLLNTTAAFGAFPSTGEGSYVFSRGVDGWSARAVASPSLGIQSGPASLYDSADFSAVGFEDSLGSISPGHTQADPPSVALVGPPGGPYRQIARGTYDVPVETVGASADLSDVFVQGKNHRLETCEVAQGALAEKLDEGSDGLYEWSSERPCLSLVDVKSSSEGGGLVSRCGAALGLDGYFNGESHGAVSADGSRAIFTAPDPQGSGSQCWEQGRNPQFAPQLYMRESGGTTVKASAPAEGVKPATTYPAMFVGASEDGSRVFFLSRSELTKSAERLGTSQPELYEYNVEGSEEASNWWERKLVRISGGEAEGAVGGVIDVPAVSADGTAVYFNAEGELTPGAHGGLYRYDTVTGKTTYVAPAQGYPGHFEEYGGEDISGRWFSSEVIGEETPGLDMEANWYATPNGRFLVFGSAGDVTGYDSGGQRELYRYEYEPEAPSGGSVVCVSCDPNGAVPSYGAAFTRSAPGITPNYAGAPPRPISENGEYVFFDTQEGLLAQDTNGMIDVYEWYDGRISSISSGQSSSEDFFLDSSAYVNGKGETVEGANVFFGTHSKLVAADQDEQGDLYDARIGGGFATSSGPGPCEGDACQNPPPAPVYQTPTSLSFSGPGDASSEAVAQAKPKAKAKAKAGKCKQGTTLKKGKCVKTKAKRQKAKAKKSDRRAR